MSTGTKPDIDQTDADFKAAFVSQMNTAKINTDAGGNPIGPLALSLIAKFMTAEYGDFIDDFVSRVQTRLSGLVRNVKEDGAELDGVADDLAAINAAIAAQTADGGGIVVVPNGTPSHTALTLASDVMLLHIFDGDPNGGDREGTDGDLLLRPGNSDPVYVKTGGQGTTGWVVFGSGGTGTLSRIPTDGDVVECWDFDQSSVGVTNLTGKVASKVLVADGSLLQAVTVSAGLDGIRLFNTGGFPGTQALRLSDQDFNLATVTVECLITWNGSGTAGAQVVGFFGVGETEATNNIWQITNHSVDGGGISLPWEFGAGTNEVHDFRVEPNNSNVYLLTMVRDDSAETLKLFINGILCGSTTYTNNPTGGTSAELIVGRDDLEELAFFGLCISDIARDDANVLARAQEVGVA